MAPDSHASPIDAGQLSSNSAELQTEEDASETINRNTLIEVARTRWRAVASAEAAEPSRDMEDARVVFGTLFIEPEGQRLYYVTEMITHISANENIRTPHNWK